MKELDSGNFDEVTEGARKPFLVEFWASWCPPCKMMEPMIEALESEFGHICGFGAVNVDRNPSLTQRFQITGVPTFLAFSTDSRIERRLVGAQTKRAIETTISQLVER